MKAYSKSTYNCQIENTNSICIKYLMILFLDKQIVCVKHKMNESYDYWGITYGLGNGNSTYYTNGSKERFIGESNCDSHVRVVVFLMIQ